MTRNKPLISRSERAMAVIARLPKSLFSTPTLSATLTLTDEGAGVIVVNLEAANAALKQALGVDIDLRITPTTEGTPENDRP